MTYHFYATDTVSGWEKVGWRYVLSSEPISWLSKNLRKRSLDNGRRYDYIKIYVEAPKYGYPPRRRQKIYKIGVNIYNEEDAMAFKLRWL